MKKSFVVISCLLIFIVLNPVYIFAKAPPKLSPECLRKMEERDKHFNKLIMQEIIANFKLDINERSYLEMSPRELLAANMVYGGWENDSYFNSINKHFIGEFRGEPRLFIKPQEAFVLYKDPDNNDVMIHLKLIGTIWGVIDQKKKKGNEIEYKEMKCEKKYFKKKKEYYSN
ncbi:hypothetical protein E1I69_07020 [Bacillus timonensis]|uniref:Uncharacterized protein n=1 Tax=Bacillus timonensis TaxID=1033734 RepID=A0A4S3PVD0_9BACI|nr:hypothetical protein [Bacillus timonensis]THE13658.1 hypothetical protein E1I69_07020 [Bacillus timonensis]